MDTQLNLTLLLPSTEAIFDLSTSTGISSTMVAFLLTVFVAFLSWSIFEYRKGIKSTNFFLALTRDLNREELAQKRFEITHSALSHETLGKLWREFDESLVLVESNNLLYNTIDAAHFFNPQNLARGLTNNRLIAAVPAFLTALGVIATFAGLQLGLASLSESTTTSTDLEGLSSGIFAMIGGASIAFMTSVWGVFLSLIFNVSEKGLERLVTRHISRLQRQIDYLYPRITAEQSLVNLEFSSRASAERLAELDEKIGHRLQEAMSQATLELREGISDSLSEVLGPAVSKLVENANGASEKALDSLMDEFLNRIGSAGDEQRAAMLTASETVQASNQQLIGGVENLLEQIKITSTESMKASDAFREIARSNAAAVANLDAAAETLHKTATSLSNHFDSLEAMTQTIDRVGQETAIIFESAKSAASDLSATQRSAMEVLDKTESKLSELSTIMLRAHIQADEGLTKIGTHFENVSESLNKHIASLEEQISHLLENYADQVNSQTTQRLNAWNEQTNQYIAAMTNAVNSLSGIVDEIDFKVSSTD